MILVVILRYNLATISHESRTEAKLQTTCERKSFEKVIQLLT
ncbi:hypothetical protein L195_g000173 [Trifolium pratense]|uniref:Uncharacterized protein n=1 Tax=Trifolium pratense TaxID=57577 RepID=A0A2K3NL43_TRIPR|nr:hypothetical protein L195_g000173 [Trifolium pratense]